MKYSYFMIYLQILYLVVQIKKLNWSHMAPGHSLAITSVSASPYWPLEREKCLKKMQKAN